MVYVSYCYLSSSNTITYYQDFKYHHNVPVIYCICCQWVAAPVILICTSPGPITCLRNEVGGYSMVISGESTMVVKPWDFPTSTTHTIAQSNGYSKVIRQIRHYSMRILENPAPYTSHVLCTRSDDSSYQCVKLTERYNYAMCV